MRTPGSIRRRCKRYTLWAFLLLGTGIPLQAQDLPQGGSPAQADTLPADTLPLPSPPASGAEQDSAITGEVVDKRAQERISSSKALLFSAIIPGGGQFYNRKYWKIPIVYGGFVALGVAIEFNQSYYNQFVRELNYRADGDPLTVPEYDEEQIPNSRIIEARDYYRRYRDLCIIGLGVLYGLNIVDAYVDAELANFDISEDLSMRVLPALHTVPGAGNELGAGITLSFAFR